MMAQSLCHFVVLLLTEACVKSIPNIIYFINHPSESIWCSDSFSTQRFLRAFHMRVINNGRLETELIKGHFD
jgi:hypothetical protein